MGTALSLMYNPIRSCYREGTVIDHGSTRRLWAYNSTSGPGKYVHMIPPTANNQTCCVKATGRAEGTTMPFTNIRFYEIHPLPQMFALQFKEGSDWYTVNASNNSVIAATNISPHNATIFTLLQLLSPNEPYFVLQSNVTQGEDILYLSSDGSGNLKLKTWNEPVVGPPDTTADVDPALLFRVVRPTEIVSSYEQTFLD